MPSSLPACHAWTCVYVLKVNWVKLGNQWRLYSNERTKRKKRETHKRVRKSVVLPLWCRFTCRLCCQCMLCMRLEWEMHQKTCRKRHQNFPSHYSFNLGLRVPSPDTSLAHVRRVRISFQTQRKRIWKEKKARRRTRYYWRNATRRAKRWKEFLFQRMCLKVQVILATRISSLFSEHSLFSHCNVSATGECVGICGEWIDLLLHLLSFWKDRSALGWEERRRQIYSMLS